MSHKPARSVLLTMEDIDRWKAEVREIESQIGALRDRQAAIQKRLDAASIFIEADPGQLPPVSVSDSGEAASSAKRSGDDATWTATIYQIVAVAQRGITHSELRREVAKTHLSERLAHSDKGFYGGIAKLKERGRLVRHGRRLFTPANLHSARAAGWLEEDDDAENTALTRSPMGEAIVGILANHGDGMVSGELIARLRHDREFARQMTANKTHFYNVIGRLVSRGILEKDGKVYRLPRLAEPPSDAPQAHAQSSPEQAEPVTRTGLKRRLISPIGVREAPTQEDRTGASKPTAPYQDAAE